VRGPIAIQNTVEYQILTMWQHCIDSAADYAAVPIEAVQRLITDTRKIMVDASWPVVYQRNFFVGLKDQLRAGTVGHPTTTQIIRLLEIETEFN
jgi:hypothetical protein